MLPPHNTPQESFTAEQIAAWMVTTQRKNLALHLLFAEPLYNTRREQAFLQLSDLLKEAIEVVRVLSATLAEDRQGLPYLCPATAEAVHGAM
jgi:hypothetical protein